MLLTWYIALYIPANITITLPVVLFHMAYYMIKSHNTTCLTYIFQIYFSCYFSSQLIIVWYSTFNAFPTMFDYDFFKALTTLHIYSLWNLIYYSLDRVLQLCRLKTYPRLWVFLLCWSSTELSTTTTTTTSATASKITHKTIS